MIYLGVYLVFSSVLFMHLHKKSQHIDVLAEDPSGRSRLIRKFVIAKKLLNHNKNCWEWEFFCYRNIVQLYSLGHTWEDVAWATVQ